MTGLERAPVICRAGQQKYSRWLCWALRRGEVNGYKGKRRKEKKGLPSSGASQARPRCPARYVPPTPDSGHPWLQSGPNWIFKKAQAPPERWPLNEGGERKKTERKKNEKSLCNPTSSSKNHPNRPIPISLFPAARPTGDPPDSDISTIGHYLIRRITRSYSRSIRDSQAAPRIARG